MRLRTHLWTSLLTGLLIYPRSPSRVLQLTFAGVALDVDHLLLYALRTGDWSISGALFYDRYRGRAMVAGDTRPRYGPLRSWLHQPLLVLPLAWWQATRYTALRPAAIGLTLHLLLDYVEAPLYWWARWRARQNCEHCACRADRLRVRRINRRGGAIWGKLDDYAALCDRCYERSLRAGTPPHYVGTQAQGVDSPGPYSE